MSKPVPRSVSDAIQKLRDVNVAGESTAREISALLEDARTGIGTASPEVHELLERARSAVTALPKMQAEGRDQAQKLIARALAAGVRFLESDGAPVTTMVEEAASRLARLVAQQALSIRVTAAGGVSTDPESLAHASSSLTSMASSTSSRASPSMSIGDAAALLIALAPEDRRGLATLETALGGLAAMHAEGAQCAGSPGWYLTRAHGRAQSALDDGARDVQRLLEEAGQLIEQADKALDDGQLRARGASETVAGLPADADMELVKGFIVEGREGLESAEASLLALELDSEDAEAVNTVFRAFHTIKGTSAFLGLTQLSGFAHEAESLLSRMRDREIRCAGRNAELALGSCDMLKAFLDAVESCLGGAPLSAPEGCAALLAALADPSVAVPSSPSSRAPAPTAIATTRAANVKGASAAPAARSAAKPSAGSPRANGDSWDLPARDDTTRASPASVASAAPVPAQPAARATARKDTAETVDSTVRVRTDRLDRLIDMVGELVIAQAMVAQDTVIVSAHHHDLGKKIGRAGKIVREIQDLSMSLRMVPLKATFQKMTRLVRDVAHKSGKQVVLVTDGDDTEIDRNMVDVLGDPLVHMVRNAVDHGIELPEVRTAAGKAPMGTVVLKACHSGGSVVVEMRDDGRGMDRDRILAKAMQKGLVESGKGLSDAEIYNLIFEPGFSTADKITDISGRGVGMDVVRRNIEAIKGRIDITTRLGHGTTFTLFLPPTLAIADGMLVAVGSERYIIPTTSIHVSFRPAAAAVSTVSGRGEIVKWRGNLIPLVRLHRLFGVPGAVEDPTMGILVVISDGERRLALLVDHIHGQQQVVAKTLGTRLCRISGISGGAILGDGCVGLILDPSGISSLVREGPELLAALAAPI